MPQFFQLKNKILRMAIPPHLGKGRWEILAARDMHSADQSRNQCVRERMTSRKAATAGAEKRER
jgi:hypothetical protein